MLQKLTKKIPYFRANASIAVFNAALILSFIFLQNYLPPVIPLYYGFPKGEAQLAPKIAICLPPLLSIIIVTINVLIISLNKNDFIHKILLGISFVVSLLSAVTTIRIFLLVSSL